MREDFVRPVLGGLAAIVITILTTSLSGLGVTVRELVTPTSAIVEGFVLRNRAPAVAEIMLDGREETRDKTDGYGQFLFAGVSAGDHCYSIIEQPEKTVWIDRFDVARGVTEKVIIANYDLAIAVPSSSSTANCLEPVSPLMSATTIPAPPSPTPERSLVAESTPFAIDMARASATLVALETFLGEGGLDSPGEFSRPALTDGGYAVATMETGAVLANALLEDAGTALGTPAIEFSDYSVALDQSSGVAPPENLQSGLPPEARLIDVQLAAQPAVLEQVSSVTYYLDPSLSPSVVTRDNADDGFALSLATSDTTTLSADVQFADGHVERLTTEVSPEP